MRFHSGAFADTCRHCLDTMDTPVDETTDDFTDEDIVSLDQLQEEESLFDSFEEEDEIYT